MSDDDLKTITAALEWMEEAVSLLESQFGVGSDVGILGRPRVGGEEAEIAAIRALLDKQPAA